jgi:S-methylmethionine-dependent homocysteine/selenocysteine methylase
MPALPFLPIIAAGAAIAGTVASIDQGRRSAKATQAQAEAERRRSEIENVYKARQSIRQARIAQAAMVNQAALTGGIGGSGVAGGVGSVGSQLAGNLSYMSSIAEENTNIFNFATTAAKASSNAAVYGQVGKLAGTIFSGMTGQTVPEAIGASLVKG